MKKILDIKINGEEVENFDHLPPAVKEHFQHIMDQSSGEVLSEQITINRNPNEFTKTSKTETADTIVNMPPQTVREASIFIVVRLLFFGINFFLGLFINSLLPNIFPSFYFPTWELIVVCSGAVTLLSRYLIHRHTSGSLVGDIPHLIISKKKENLHKYAQEFILGFALNIFFFSLILLGYNYFLFL